MCVYLIQVKAKIQSLSNREAYLRLTVMGQGDDSEDIATSYIKLDGNT